MGHVTRDVPWCTVDIDTADGKIVVLEKWQYEWLVETGSTQRWTLAEKRAFHEGAEREIWSVWSNRAFMKVSGTSEFAKRFSGGSVPVFMDIRWVLAKPHWTVKVTKIRKGVDSTSRTSWWGRTINLDSNDLTPRTRCLGPPKEFICASQIPVAHEFGHALGNVAAYARGDEYRSGHEHQGDMQSIMHRGVELRNRHFDALLSELNLMIPDTSFTVERLQ